MSFRNEGETFIYSTEALKEAYTSVKVCFRDLRKEFPSQFIHINSSGRALVALTPSHTHHRSLSPTSQEEPETIRQPDYLDANNPRYAPKLAAAIGAWQHAKLDSRKSDANTPKKALSKWLQDNIEKYCLEKSKQTIEEISKISNWNRQGGAPKTPNDS